MLADSGLLAAMKPGATYIDVSTIDPTTARKLSNAANVRGIHFLACPLGKTPAHAEKAEEPIFAGGNKEIFEKNKPVLEIIGSPIYYLGKMENGGGDEAGPKVAAMMRLDEPVLDWVSLARGMGVPGTRVDSSEAFIAALSRGIEKPGSFLIEALI